MSASECMARVPQPATFPSSAKMRGCRAGQESPAFCVQRCSHHAPPARRPERRSSTDSPSTRSSRFGLLHHHRRRHAQRHRGTRRRVAHGARRCERLARWNRPFHPTRRRDHAPRGRIDSVTGARSIGGHRRDRTSRFARSSRCRCLDRPSCSCTPDCDRARSVTATSSVSTKSGVRTVGRELGTSTARTSTPRRPVTRCRHPRRCTGGSDGRRARRSVDRREVERNRPFGVDELLESLDRADAPRRALVPHSFRH